MKTLFQPLALTGAVLMLASCGGDVPAGAQANIVTTMSSKQSASQQLSASDYHDVVQKIYVGYFGRPADPAGLAFFANRLLQLNAPTTVQGISEAYRTNADIRQVVDVFGTSQESADLYPGTNSVFMDAVYRNLFGREADAAGKEFWVNALNQGLVTRGDAAVSVMSGAQGDDITVVDKKTTVAAFFTSSLATSAQKAAYDGLSPNVVARNMLANVGLATDTTAFRESVTNTVTTLVGALPPAGLYFGKLNGSGSQFQTIVTETGEYWGLYSQSGTGHFTPTGLLQGPGSFSNGKLTSPDIRDLNPAQYNLYAYSGNLLPQTSLDGTITSSAGSIGIGVSTTPPTTYDFNVPANLADIEGAWAMNDVDNARLTTTVSATAFSGTANNCAFSGTLKPRATGKNLFDAAITYGATSTGCRLTGQSATGVGYTYLADEGATRQLFVAVTNAARTSGNVLQGAKVMPIGIAPAFVATDTVVGTGALATAGKYVTVHYTGWLYNATSPNLRSTKFDSSVDRKQLFEFQLGVGYVIKGWDEGVAGMRVGGKRILIIPASMGYGATGSGNLIKPNASLVFEVEVFGVR